MDPNDRYVISCLTRYKIVAVIESYARRRRLSELLEDLKNLELRAIDKKLSVIRDWANQYAACISRNEKLILTYPTAIWTVFELEESPEIVRVRLFDCQTVHHPKADEPFLTNAGL